MKCQEPLFATCVCILPRRNRYVYTSIYRILFILHVGNIPTILTILVVALQMTQSFVSFLRREERGEDESGSQDEQDAIRSDERQATHTPIQWWMCPVISLVVVHFLSRVSISVGG